MSSTLPVEEKIGKQGVAEPKKQNGSGVVNGPPPIFVSHGPGPYPIIWNKSGDHADLTLGYQKLLARCGVSCDAGSGVRAILVVSAHWETQGAIRVTGQTKHRSLLYDYEGFPEETYRLRYDCAGDPRLAQEVCKALQAARIPCEVDNDRLLDHGVFVPLLLVLPRPPQHLPILQLSLPALGQSGERNAALCLEMGRALKSLRRSGVLLIGSGQATHGSFRRPGDAKEFVCELTRTVTHTRGTKRESLLRQWERSLPHARCAHGREEHLLPLMVCAGAAGEDQGTLVSDGWWNKMSMAHYCFGASCGDVVRHDATNETP